VTSAYLCQVNFYRHLLVENFQGVMSRLSLERIMSNLKSEALTILELLAGGHVTLIMPPCQKILRGHVRTVSGKMHVKYEVCSFNRFGATSFNAQNVRGHMTLATPPFRKICKGSCPDCPWEHARQI